MLMTPYDSLITKIYTCLECRKMLRLIKYVDRKEITLDSMLKILNNTFFNLRYYHKVSGTCLRDETVRCKRPEKRSENS